MPPSFKGKRQGARAHPRSLVVPEIGEPLPGFFFNLATLLALKIAFLNVFI